MPKITQYYPTFFDVCNKEVATFNNTEELLSIPFVNNFKDDNFSGFELIVHQDQCSLIATYNNNTIRCVVGNIDDSTVIELPKKVYK
jgi:hypothetical protein